MDAHKESAGLVGGADGPGKPAERTDHTLKATQDKRQDSQAPDDDDDDNDNDNDDDDVESLVGTMDRSRDHTRRRQKSHAELLRERRSLLAHL